MQNKIVTFSSDTSILGAASVVGKCEWEGPFGDCFDLHDCTDRFGKKTWESAESEMQRLSFNIALSKASMRERDVDAMLAGDLLNQCVGSAYGLLDFDIPYFGLYGACSTAVEGLMLSAMLTSADYFGVCAAVTSSHNCAAERQYRTPLEYGAQRTPTAQWTVTGAGAFLVGKGGPVRIREALPGIVLERGISDTNNMGAAMAPAAASTLRRYFSVSSLLPAQFDRILTGDLGAEGLSILTELLADMPQLTSRLDDCGVLIYDREKQDKHAGGSGCGCSAVMLASYVLPKLIRREWKRVLLVGTGAMMSPASIQQGAAIPAIAHLICLESAENATAHRGQAWRY